MGKVAILTDSNSGITQAQSKELGVKVIPMPFFIDGEQYFEDINLTQEEFYEKLQQDADISTSQPSIGEMQDAFDELLKEFQKEHGFTDEDMDGLKNDDLEQIVPIFAFSSKSYVNISI